MMAPLRSSGGVRKLDTLESLLRRVHHHTYCRSSGYLAPSRDSGLCLGDSSTRRAAFLCTYRRGQSRRRPFRRPLDCTRSLRCASHADGASGPYFIFGRVPDGDISLESGSLGSPPIEDWVLVLRTAQSFPAWLFYRLSSITGGGRFVFNGRSPRALQTRLGKRRDHRHTCDGRGPDASRTKVRPASIHTHGSDTFTCGKTRRDAYVGRIEQFQANAEERTGRQKPPRGHQSASAASINSGESGASYRAALITTVVKRHASFGSHERNPDFCRVNPRYV